MENAPKTISVWRKLELCASIIMTVIGLGAVLWAKERGTAWTSLALGVTFLFAALVGWRDDLIRNRKNSPPTR